MELFVIIMALAGTIAGFFLPEVARRITVYKANIRGKEIKGNYFDTGWFNLNVRKNKRR